ncbi:MAG: hypothetical protein ACKVOK_10015 [Flavobacteriales bacterium]
MESNSIKDNIKNSESNKELAQHVRNLQEKFAYYIIGLDVAAIGFAIHQTVNQPLNYSQIPVGVAVICWSFSIWSGLSLLITTIESYKANINYIETGKGRNIMVGNDPNRIALARSIFYEKMVKSAEKGLPLFKRMNILFKLGVMLFIIWHVWEMYNLT